MPSIRLLNTAKKLKPESQAQLQVAGSQAAEPSWSQRPAAVACATHSPTPRFPQPCACEHFQHRPHITLTGHGHNLRGRPASSKAQQLCGRRQWGCTASKDCWRFPSTQIRHFYSHRACFRQVNGAVHMACVCRNMSSSSPQDPQHLFLSHFTLKTDDLI